MATTLRPIHNTVITHLRSVPAVPRPVRLVVVALALAAGTLACGDDGADPDPQGAPPGEPALDGSPADLCTAVLNERDATVAEAGRGAALDVVLWAQQDEPPTAEEADAGVEALAAWRDQLAVDQERLAGADVAAADAEAWDDLVGGFDDEIERLDARIAVLRADDWEEAVAGLEIGGEGDVTEAVEALGLQGRDCEVVVTAVGTPPDHAGFVTEAASACSSIVSRRRAGTFHDDLEVVVEGVAAAYEGEPVVADDELAGALGRVVEEWVATRDDLAGVAADEAPDPEGWEQVVGLAEDRVAGYSARLDALETGDQAEIDASFSPGVLSDPGWEGFEPNHLGSRDCRSVEA
jgi:hypothetical protein